MDCDKRDNGCNGGLPENAYKTLMELGGLELESEYGQDCLSCVCSLNVFLSGMTVRMKLASTTVVKWL